MKMQLLAAGAWARRLFRNRVVMPIVAFVALLVVAFATECRAADNSELWLEVGTTIVRNESPVVGFAVAWPDAGPKDTDFGLSLHLVGESEGVSNQSALGLTITDGFGDFDIGFGLCLLHHEDVRNGSRANFMLTIAYNFGKRLQVRERHCSNAGQTDTNKGLDLAVAGWRF